VQVYTLPTTGILAPTTSGRTLDVSAAGEAGVDWANVGSPTTTLNLSGTTVKTATDVETDTQDIQDRLPAALISGRVDASVGAMQANVVTASAIAADAIAASELAADAVAEIAAAVSISGSTIYGEGGSISFTYTVYDVDGITPIEGVAVYVSSDISGTYRSQAKMTDSVGRVTFDLDPATVYFWRSRYDRTFSNPDTETVS
jgi:hypothetical protein